MNVNGINSFKYSSSNKSSVKNTRNLTAPSFKWTLKPNECELLKGYLPSSRWKFFEREMKNQLEHPRSPLAKKASDTLLRKAIFEARIYKFVSGFTTTLSDLFVPPTKKAA